MYRRLGGPQCRSGRVGKISPPPGFDSRTVQPVASRHTDWTIAAPPVFCYFCVKFDAFWYCLFILTVFFVDVFGGFVRLPWFKWKIVIVYWAHIAHLPQQCHNSKSVIFQEKLLKVSKCFNFLWVQQRHNCFPAAEYCKLLYDTTCIPVKSASTKVSFYTNNSKMPNFELWHSCRKWAVCPSPCCTIKADEDILTPQNKERIYRIRKHRIRLQKLDTKLSSLFPVHMLYFYEYASNYIYIYIYICVCVCVCVCSIYNLLTWKFFSVDICYWWNHFRD